METTPLIIALIAMTPLMAYVMWSDLKSLRIPNWVVLAVLGVYLVTGLWGLPLEVFLWRLAFAAGFLVVGFGIFALAGGKVGAGDMKLIAVLIPFVSASDVLFVLFVYGVVTLVGLMLHRLIRARLKGRKTGWMALDQSIYYPVGLVLGITTLIYLGVQVADRIYAAAA
ncbi:MAG TPA: prepilin peptidase [Thermohalobaculum sp.]|nr:prepilin peptidase [Thermohalobaculum sp.]